MMGIADYITIVNGLFGTLAIFFLLLAVDDMGEPYTQGGVLTDYIWAAMLCILLSAIGDIIEATTARWISRHNV